MGNKSRKALHCVTPQTVQVEVGDDPSNPQVIVPHGTKETSNKAVKEEIIVDYHDEDALCDDAMKVPYTSALFSAAGEGLMGKATFR